MHADVHIKSYIGVSYRRTFHERGRTVGLSLERLGEASVLSLKEKNSFLFSASSSPKELTGYVFLCVVKESSINQFQVQAYIKVMERINNAKK
jgi:hypothetical protein